jgi:hypothetical protein
MTISDSHRKKLQPNVDELSPAVRAAIILAVVVAVGSTLLSSWRVAVHVRANRDLIADIDVKMKLIQADMEIMRLDKIPKKGE